MKKNRSGQTKDLTATARRQIVRHRLGVHLTEWHGPIFAQTRNMTDTTNNTGSAIQRKYQEDGSGETNQSKFNSR